MKFKSNFLNKLNDLKNKYQNMEFTGYPEERKYIRCNNCTYKVKTVGYHYNMEEIKKAIIRDKKTKETIEFYIANTVTNYALKRNLIYTPTKEMQ